MSRARLVMAVMVGASLTSGCKKLDGSRCADNDCLFSPDEWKVVRSLANVSRTPPPEDWSNKYLPRGAWQSVEGDGVTIESMPPVVRLGWRLYHDPRLSGDGADPKDSLGRAALPPRPEDACAGLLGISCATCHDPLAFGSDITSEPPNVSNGAGWYDVNGQQTLNSARFHPFFYWNGRTSTLWAQAAQVMESPVSMKGNRLRTLFIVSQHYLDADGYATVFDEPAPAEIQRLAQGLTFTMSTKALMNAYSRPDTDSHAYSAADKDAITRVHVNVAKAIAAYEWFLRSDGSRFDRFVGDEVVGDAGGADLASAHQRGSSELLSPSEKRGLKLFIGHAGCVNCHNTPLFSDGKFHNIGVPQAGAHVPTVAACVGDPGAPSCDCRDGGTDKSCLPSGAYGGVQKRKKPEFGACSNYDDRRADGGLPDACGADAATDLPRWGSWRTPSLRDVAMTGPYMHDGVFATLADVIWHYDQGGGGEGDGGSELAPLNLTDQDRSDLVAFLGTLTGTPGPTALTLPPPVPDGGYMACPTVDGATSGASDAAAADDGGAGDGQ